MIIHHSSAAAPLPESVLSKCLKLKPNIAKRDLSFTVSLSYIFRFLQTFGEIFLFNMLSNPKFKFQNEVWWYFSCEKTFLSVAQKLCMFWCLDVGRVSSLWNMIFIFIFHLYQLGSMETPSMQATYKILYLFPSCIVNISKPPTTVLTLLPHKVITGNPSDRNKFHSK